MLSLDLIQVACVIALSVWPVFRTMGRDYEGVVIASGCCGFTLGTTANAMANMEALVERYGARAAGVPGRPDGRRVLHRLHERAGDYRFLNFLR